MALLKEISIVLKNSFAELETLSLALKKFGDAHHLPLKVILDINLALDEIFTNIVSYGFKDFEEHLINIHLLINAQELTIKIQDDGIPFNPMDIPAPDLDAPLAERKAGGLGIHLVKKKMDEMHYQRRQGKTYCFLRKN